MGASALQQFQVVEKVMELEESISRLQTANEKARGISPGERPVLRGFARKFVITKLKKRLNCCYAVLARMYEPRGFVSEQYAPDRQGLAENCASTHVWMKADLEAYYTAKSLDFERTYGNSLAEGLAFVAAAHSGVKNSPAGTKAVKQQQCAAQDKSVTAQLAAEVHRYKFLKYYIYYHRIKKQGRREDKVRKPAKRADRPGSTPVLCLACECVVAKKMAGFHAQSKRHVRRQKDCPASKAFHELPLLQRVSVQAALRRYSRKARAALQAIRSAEGELSTDSPAAETHDGSAAYQCEICRADCNDVRAYLQHFSESRHREALAGFGIEQPGRYRGICTESALLLAIGQQERTALSWEECEDDDGNVYDIRTYEDLVQNGLL
ncbi:hypothetical protein PAPHI01_1094 [Pancytospora philotis]|nr:hypothetical protein PAPHI01_1094 [Pancytospora philotis]